MTVRFLHFFSVISRWIRLFFLLFSWFSLSPLLCFSLSLCPSFSRRSSPRPACGVGGAGSLSHNVLFDGIFGTARREEGLDGDDHDDDDDDDEEMLQKPGNVIFM